MNRSPRKTCGATGRAWIAGLMAAVSVAGCATSGDPPLPSASAIKGTGHPGDDSQQPVGDDSCTSCSSSGGGSGSGSGGGTAGSDDSSLAADDAGEGDDASAPTGGDDAGPPPFMFPPITLPDSGGSSPGDGGPNSCTTKICIDPVFDCPLQGCFNGCTNFFCN